MAKHTIERVLGTLPRQRVYTSTKGEPNKQWTTKREQKTT